MDYNKQTVIKRREKRRAASPNSTEMTTRKERGGVTDASSKTAVDCNRYEVMECGNKY